MKPKRVKCKICGKPFTPVNHSNKLCSKKCRELSTEQSLIRYRKLHPTPPAPDKMCAICGEPLEFTSVKGRGRKYHGDAKDVGSCAWKALQQAVERQKKRREESKKAKLLQETK